MWVKLNVSHLILRVLRRAHGRHPLVGGVGMPNRRHPRRVIDVRSVCVAIALGTVILGLRGVSGGGVRCYGDADQLCIARRVCPVHLCGTFLEDFSMDFANLATKMVFGYVLSCRILC